MGNWQNYLADKSNLNVLGLAVPISEILALILSIYFLKKYKKEYYDNNDFDTDDVYDIFKGTTREDEWFVYAEVPSYLKISEKPYKKITIYLKNKKSVII